MGYISTCLAKCQLINYHRINVKKRHPRKDTDLPGFACHIGQLYKIYGGRVEQPEKA